jgi:hypothetical protein
VASNFQSHTTSQLATLAVIYSSYEVISATDVYFLLNHGMIPDPILKKHPKVLF